MVQNYTGKSNSLVGYADQSDSLVEDWSDSNYRFTLPHCEYPVGTFLELPERDLLSLVVVIAELRIHVKVQGPRKFLIATVR